MDMRHFFRLRIAAFQLPVLVIFALASCGKAEKLPEYGDLDDKPELLELTFVNQDGNSVTMNDYAGRVRVVDFIFTHCPTICPGMTAEMRRVQVAHEVAGDALHFLSFSVDPERDTVEQLQFYADLYEADTRNWHFLTGNKKDIYRIAREGYMVTALEGDGGPDDFIHSPLFVLVDDENNIRGYYDGTDTAKMTLLKKDIFKLLK